MSNNLKKFDLAGKVALITGGAGLLGKQHAAALAECGAKVVVTDIRAEQAEMAVQELKKEWGDFFCAEKMDVTSFDSIRSVATQVSKEWGEVAILINNAAIDPKVEKDAIVETSRFENFSLDQWNFQLSVGLTGSFLCSQVFGSAMAARGQGVILNISSDLSVFAPDQRLYRKEGLPEDRQPVKPVTYSVIKTALVGLTRYLAGYWADKGVRVNALSPGGVYTSQDQTFVKRLTNLIPLGKMADADDYRSAVQFLCSEASKYMTGQNIVMDGGRSIL